MKGKHPKRRKVKDNPYSICEVDGRYFLSFKDGKEGVMLEEYFDYTDCTDVFEMENITDEYWIAA